MVHNFYQIFIFGLIIILFVKSKGEEYETNFSYILRYTEENQYLPNLIQLYENNEVYLDIVKYSNGDIVIEFIDNIQYANRIFFGLKANGRYLYGDEKIMSDESLISISDNGHSCGGVSSFIAKDEDNNEYMISSILDSSSYFDIYDFGQKTKFSQYYSLVLGLEKKEEMSTFLKIKVNNEYYMIICGCFCHYDVEQLLFKLIKINIIKEENPSIHYITDSVEIAVNINDFKGCYNVESENI